MIENDVVAIILAYRDTRDLVTQVIESCREQGVTKVVVVGNEVTAGFATELEVADSGGDVSIRFSTTEHNRGSAGGYADGLRAASVAFPDADRYLLLDDDNLPMDECVEKLRDALDELEELDGATPVAAAARRIDRPYDPLPAADAAAALDRGAFLGVDLPAQARRWWRPVHVPGGAPVAPGHGLCLPWAPFGGLMLPKTTVAAIGEPCRSFFMYADDLEYSARIPRAGGQIRFVPDALVVDARPSALGITADVPFSNRVLHARDPSARDRWLTNEMRRHRILNGRSARLAVNTIGALARVWLSRAARQDRWRGALRVSIVTVRAFFAPLPVVAANDHVRLVPSGR